MNIMKVFNIPKVDQESKVNGKCEKVNKDDLVNEDDKNLYKVVCRRCKSLIFPEDVVMYVENQPKKLKIMCNHGIGPAQFETISWWWYTENDLIFDTIGWQTVDGQKVLMCGDCELGPIGVRSADNKKFWVAVERVKYSE